MIAPELLRQHLLNDQLPGVAYMLIWGELQEGSDEYKALSQVIFDHASTPSPEDAPTRDLSDPSVRQGVFDCAMKFTKVRLASEKVLCEMGAAKSPRPWWKIW